MKKNYFNKFISSIGLIVATTPLCAITACGAAINYSEKITKEYPFINANKQEVCKVNITFFNEIKDVAYITVEDAFGLAKVVHEKYFADANFLTTVEINGSIAKVTRNNGAVLTINADNDTLTFDDYGLFTTPGTVRTEVLTRDYGQIKKHTETGIKYLSYGDTFNRVKRLPSKVFNLGKYNIDIVVYKGNVYLPFTTFSDMLLSDVYTPLAVMKDIIIDASFDKGEYPGRKFPEWIKKQAITVTPELLDFNYRELCFFLDYYYSWSKKTEYPDFNTLLTINGYKEKMLKSVNDCNDAINNMVAYLLDDNHSKFQMNSPSDTRDETHPISGPCHTYMGNERARMAKLREQKLGENVPGYTTCSSDQGATQDTAVITFDGFEALDETKHDWYTSGVPSSLEAVEDDTIGLFLYSYNQIKNNSNIKNVIVDLSVNGGGDERACTFVAGMLGGGEVSLSYRNVVDQATNTGSFYVDCNLDGRIDENDWVLRDKNVYVLTSRFSFSCGTMLSAFVANLPNCKIIGKQTGGGACVVTPSSNALGTVGSISGPYEAGYIKNGVFYDYDEGIDPAFYVDDSIYYERDKLAQYIVNHRG